MTSNQIPQFDENFTVSFDRKSQLYKVQKDITNKPPLEHLAGFLPALEELSRVSEFGNTKYEPNSWQTVPSKKYYGALLRHSLKFLNNQKIDDESKLHHLAHAAWCCLAIITLEKDNEV